MDCKELVQLFDKGRRRWHLIGAESAGVVAGLDLEGRLFCVLGGEVLNRVNPEALPGHSTREVYLNPAGDGLWPAPEGTALGYQYATGAWAVPPGIAGARYRVTEEGKDSATIRAEIDLVNNIGVGIPAAFERRISLSAEGAAISVRVEERIEYLGSRTLTQDECLLAPWTLAQFDSGPGCEVVFPAPDASAIRDLYDPSDAQRCCKEKLWHTKTDGAQRYQIGLDRTVQWIEFRDPGRGLAVRRSAEPPAAGHDYIDIIDAPPSEMPSGPGVRYSVYSDPACFMEIEAAGGCPPVIEPGCVMGLTVCTEYRSER